LKTLFQHYILFIFIFCTASYLTAQKSDVGSINNAFLVFYFPQLSEISAGIDKNAPLIKESRQYIEESKSNRLIADSAKGLSVNFNLSGQSIHENRPGQSYNQTYRTVGSVFVRKPLYHWGILDSQSRIAELAESYAIQKTDSVHSNLLIEVKAEFMNLLLLKKRLLLENESLKFSENLEKELSKRKEIGLGTELEVTVATISKLEHSIKISQIKRTLENKKTVFKYDTGYNKELDLSIPKEFLLFCETHSFKNNFPQVIGSHSSGDIEELKTLIKTEKENSFIAKNSQKPKINLVGGFYQDQIDLPDNPDSVRRNNFLVGVEANWNLWDSSRSKGQRQLALARKRKFEIQLESSVRKLRSELTSLQSQIKSIIDQINLSRKLLLATKSQYGKSKIEFEQNQITTKDLLTSKINLIDAELSLTESVLTYFRIKFKYEALTQFQKY
jgi:outer membrane protein TolC